MSINDQPITPFNPKRDDPVFWQLEYAGGTLVTEPPHNASIVEAKKGATRLNLVDAQGTVLSSFPLSEDGVTYLPIFCRVRTASLSPQANGHPNEQLVATIYGRGRMLLTDVDRMNKRQNVQIDGTVRMWAQGREYVDIPQTLIPQGGIMHCLNR